MSYSMRYTEKAIQSLKKLNRSVLILIKSWIEKNLVDTDDPRRARLQDQVGQSEIIPPANCNEKIFGGVD